ncbi:sensor protein CitS [Clostridium sp. BL-8]|nr:sensor protein CitS [Clostridium sp. BL-8]
MLTLLIDILYPLISVLTILVPVINFTFFTKLNKRNLVIFTFILYIFTIFLCKYKLNYLSTITLFIGSFIYILLIYKTIVASIVISIFIGSFVFVCDAITGFLFVCIFQYRYLTLLNDTLLYFLSGLCVLLFSYIFSKLSRIIILKILNKIDVNLEFPSKFRKLVIITLIIPASIFSILVGFLKGEVNIGDTSIISIYTLAAFLLLLSAVTLIYYTFKTLINTYKEKEFIQLRDYTIMLENMYKDLRSFKHDYLNILSTLETFIQNLDINGLKKYYYKDLLPESNNIMKKDISLSLLSHIKLNPLKALLSSKIINAHSKGINVKIEILDDIENLNISTIHICRIIGILMDNAIEGSALCNNKFIHFAIIKTDTDVIFNITNSCLESTPPIQKIYQKNFSTKGENRGIGLNTVRYLIDKYYKNILLNTSIEDCIFKQELIIHS